MKLDQDKHLEMQEFHQTKVRGTNIMPNTNLIHCPASIVLVGGVHGINTLQLLINRNLKDLRESYITESKTDGYKELDISGLHTRAQLDAVDELITLGLLYYRDIDGNHWKVEFSLSDIIAINPAAQWCESSDCYIIPAFQHCQ